MAVTAQFKCEGCDATTAAPLSSEFVSVSGRNYGFGRRIEGKASDVAPAGWVAFDPYTGICYCPECWRQISAGIASL